MSKNILITGVTGNLGQAVAQRFLAEGHKVIGTVLPGDTRLILIQRDWRK